MFDTLQFDIPQDGQSLIKVIGVGGGGSNAVNYMYNQGIKGVDFIVCNTDSQALAMSPVAHKIQLGGQLTGGRGAGANPSVGKESALESLEDLKAMLASNTNMVFITAGMGGGTGTGAAPIIAKLAKEMGILTVGIITVPFGFEGKKRHTFAEEGVLEMRAAVDTLLIIRNDKLRELFGNLTLNAAFGHADEVLCTAAKGIAEVMTLTGLVNVDMNDVKAVMQDSGVAIMGSGRASGENRAHRAVDMALESPLLNDSDIYGAKHVLLNITHGADELTMDEISEITDTIQERAGSANVIWGYGHDGRLGDEICITVIATGWDAKDIDAVLPGMQTQVSQVVVDVNTKAEEMVSISSVEAPVNQAPQEITAPVVSPVMRFELDNEPQAVSPFEAMQHAEVEEKEETPFVQNEVEFEIEFPAEEEGFEVRNVTDISHDTEVSAVEFKIKESVVHNQEENASPFQMLGFESMESSNATEDVHMPFRETAQNQAERNTMGHLQTERVDRIRQLTQKMKTPNGLSSLEDEPAYVRRKISLDVAPDSQSSMASRFGMNEVTDANGEKRYELKNNNPFLHDNAD